MSSVFTAINPQPLVINELGETIVFDREKIQNSFISGHLLIVATHLKEGGLDNVIEDCSRARENISSDYLKNFYDKVLELIRVSKLGPAEKDSLITQVEVTLYPEDSEG